MGNWPDTKFERDAIEAVDDSRNKEAMTVVQQWQDGAITYLEMVNWLDSRVTLEDHKYLDQTTGVKRTKYAWQAHPDQECASCEYVATIAGLVDVWFCRTATNVSLIARYGGEPHEYASYGMTVEQWDGELALNQSRYHGFVGGVAMIAADSREDVIRRHAIVEMVAERMPTVVLNMCSFPGKEPVTMARSGLVRSR